MALFLVGFLCGFAANNVAGAVSLQKPSESSTSRAAKASPSAPSSSVVPAAFKEGASPSPAARVTPASRHSADPAITCKAGWAKDSLGYCFEVTDIKNWISQDDPTGDKNFTNYVACLVDGLKVGQEAASERQQQCLAKYYPGYY